MSTLPQPSALSIVSSFSSSLTVPLAFSLLADSHDSNSLHPPYPHLPLYSSEKGSAWNEFCPTTPKPSALSVTPVSSLFVPSPHTAPVAAPSTMAPATLTLVPPCTTLRSKTSEAVNMSYAATEDLSRVLLLDHPMPMPVSMHPATLATPAATNPRPPSMQLFNAMNGNGAGTPSKHHHTHSSYTNTSSALVMPPTLGTIPFVQSNQATNASAANTASASASATSGNSSSSGVSVTRRDKLPMKSADGSSTNSNAGTFGVGVSSSYTYNVHNSDNGRMSLDLSPSENPHIIPTHLTPSSSSSMPLSMAMPMQMSLPVNLHVHVQPMTHFGHQRAPPAVPHQTASSRMTPAQHITTTRSQVESGYLNTTASDYKQTFNAAQLGTPAASFSYPIPMPMPKSIPRMSSTGPESSTTYTAAIESSAETTRRTSKRKLAAISTSTSNNATANISVAATQKTQSARVSSTSTQPRRAQRRRRRSSAAALPPSPSSAPVRPRMRMINGRLRPPILSPARLASHRKYDAKRRKIFQSVFTNLRCALVSGQSAVKEFSEGCKKKKKSSRKKKDKDEKKTVVEARVNNYSIAELLLESANTIRSLTELKKDLEKQIKVDGQQFDEEEDEENSKKRKKRSKTSKVKKEEESQESSVSKVKSEECICETDLETLKSVLTFLFQCNDSEDEDDAGSAAYESTEEDGEQSAADGEHDAEGDGDADGDGEQTNILDVDAQQDVLDDSSDQMQLQELEHERDQERELDQESSDELSAVAKFEDSDGAEEF